MFVGNTYHFVSDCLVSFDIIGTVKDYSVINNELVLIVETGSKIMQIGTNSNVRLEPLAHQ